VLLDYTLAEVFFLFSFFLRAAALPFRRLRRLSGGYAAYMCFDWQTPAFSFYFILVYSLILCFA